jgi:demethylmenaquinone methyltransferase/2-methoxy-6-polyprenyl-1,4-benzoquinol methylase
MFSSIAPRYDITNTVLSFGIHHRWRRRVARECKVRPGQHVLDCATGTGDLALEFKRWVGPEGSVLGTDFCDDMLSFAPGKAQQKGLDVQFELADVLNLPYEDDRFDLASISFGIRNVDSPIRCLQEMARVVRPGGTVAVLEFGGQPEGLFGMLYDLHARYVMPFLGGLLSGNKEAYRYLPRTAAQYPHKEKFLEIMDKADCFSSRRYIPFTFGVAYLYIGTVR